MAARRTHPLSTPNNYGSVGLQHGTHPVISGKNSSQTSIRITSRVATGSYSPSRCRSLEEGCSRDSPSGGMMERINRSYDSSKRMKARIKASRAGLEELTVLRHKQQQLVEQAKVLVTGMRTPVRRRSLPWMKQTSSPEEEVDYEAPSARIESGSRYSQHSSHTTTPNAPYDDIITDPTALSATSPLADGTYSSSRGATEIVYDGNTTPTGEAGKCYKDDKKKKNSRHVIENWQIRTPGREDWSDERHLSDNLGTKSGEDDLPCTPRFLSCRMREKVCGDNIVSQAIRLQHKKRKDGEGEVSFSFPSPMHAILMQYDSTKLALRENLCVLDELDLVSKDAKNGSAHAARTDIRFDETTSVNDSNSIQSGIISGITKAGCHLNAKSMLTRNQKRRKFARNKSMANHRCHTSKARKKLSLTSEEGYFSSNSCHTSSPRPPRQNELVELRSESSSDDGFKSNDSVTSDSHRSRDGRNMRENDNEYHKKLSQRDLYKLYRAPSVGRNKNCHNAMLHQGVCSPRPPLPPPRSSSLSLDLKLMAARSHEGLVYAEPKLPPRPLKAQTRKLHCYRHVRSVMV